MNMMISIGDKDDSETHAFEISESALRLSENVNFMLQKLTTGDMRDTAEFLNQSRYLMECLFAPNLNEKLRTLPVGTCLEFCGALEFHQVPWEALAFDDQFLGERYGIGRLIEGLNRSPFSDVATNNSPPVRPAAIAIADSPELVQVGVESIAVKSLLRQLSWEHPDWISEPICEYHQLTTATAGKLINDSDWFHFAGHAIDESGTRQLKVNNMERLGPTEIDNLPRTPSVVFLNACGAVELPRVINDSSCQHGCLVNSFLNNGTNWLIGSTAPVPDWDCRPFVNSFYEAVLAGNPPGQALRLARVQSRRELQNATYLPLAFVLYGRPCVHPFHPSPFPVN